MEGENMKNISNYAINYYDAPISKFELATLKMKYKVFDSSDQRRISEYSIKQINKSIKTKKFTSFISKIRRILSCPAPQNVEIPVQAFELVAYLKTKARSEVGMFRIPGCSIAYEKLSNMLLTDEDIQFTKHDVSDLASALKHFIRVELDGLIPTEICDTVLKAYSEVDHAQIEHINRYINYVLSGDRRKLLSEMFELFRDLDNASGITLMTYKNLALIFPFTLFPKKYRDSYENAKLMTNILMDMFIPDYTKISIDMYCEFKRCISDR